ncbi:MAG: 4Fe-4S binding protein [Thermodesulfobacteriota bacterium]|nr:4Fe-4S binding protein [Thermodesulfobacteriota bacterium]
MKVKRKIIEIDEDRCTGCGQCVIACAEGAIEIVDGKAKVISDNLCDGLGACLGDCPEDALKIVEREAEEFDEEAVMAHLEDKGADGPSAPEPPGCPSAGIRMFDGGGGTPCQKANKPAAVTSTTSHLAHWPVQINLIPPTAPFLKNADLLVAADCVPVAYPGFQAEFMPGRAVMIGCPKFDDTKSYRDKFVEIFNVANINTITCVMMEVPCCRGLPTLLADARKAAGRDIPLEVVTVSSTGEIKDRRRI